MAVAGPCRVRRARQTAAMPVPHRSVFGPLAPLVAEPGVTDVFVNPDGTVWVDRGTGARPEPGLRVPAGEARELAVRLVAAGGRHLDEAAPCGDVRIGDGIRVHGVLPPISPGAAVLSIRIPSAAALDLDLLEGAGMFARVPRTAVAALVARRANLLVTGAGGVGKTTLLGALLGAAPAHERIVLVEDVAELRVAHPHVVRLEARQPNLEGAGAVGLDRLVREALRMRPDRLVVGECRGAELRELLIALNTGHDGGAGTLHANSLADVPVRLEALGALAGWSADALARQAVSAFDAVLHLERTDDGRRAIAELGALRLTGRGRLVAEAA
ncbi:TadA family conjugal transfer-associated ATPase [Protaetiibacter intestinalis]|uniref:TadA family conjugal transfer-associated ATPase n=2 Tax=Protaetiibacter intestinalis TaxID=2419774 RepID=A0A387B907_9MICO|nr:TadA family conjugal transfer-associated ATPase [Protaetiibacter intestinalis]